MLLSKQNIGNIVPKEWPKVTALKPMFTKVVWKVDKELHSCKLFSVYCRDMDGSKKG